MKYIIETVGNSSEIDGKFGTQIRTSFKVEGDNRDLSAFSKFPLKVGQEIDGVITQKDQWWNFKFTPKTFETKASPSFEPAGDLLRVERKLDAIMTEQQLLRGIFGEMKGVMSDILSKVDKDPLSGQF